MNKQNLDLKGTVHNEIEFIENIGTQNGKRIWLCRCLRDGCGNLFKARQDNVLSGNTKSCGCLRFQKCRNTGTLNKKKNAVYFPDGLDFCLVFYENVDGFFIVDCIIYPLIENYTWTSKRHGSWVIPVTSINGKNIELSRFLMDTPPHLECDHINHYTEDNRICNLRNCTKAQNLYNREGIGVTITETIDGKFIIIKFNMEDVSLLTFNNYQQAQDWLNTLQAKYYGEFSYRKSQEISAKYNTHLSNIDQKYILGGVFSKIEKLPYKNPLKLRLLMLQQALQNKHLQFESYECDRKLLGLVRDYQDYKNATNCWE